MKSFLFLFFLLPASIKAQVSYQSALDLAQSRASRMSGEVTASKIGNLKGGKRNYWFIAVFYDGSACLMSIPETKLEIASTKCVNQYQIDGIIETFNNIEEYVDPLELKKLKQQEQFALKQKEEEEKLRIKQIEEDRKIKESQTKMIAKSLDSLVFLKEYEKAAYLFANNQLQLDLNSFKEIIYKGILDKYSSDTILISKETSNSFIKSNMNWFKAPLERTTLYFNTSGQEIYNQELKLDQKQIPVKNFGTNLNPFNVPMNSKIILIVNQKDDVLVETQYFSSMNKPIFKSIDKEVFFFKSQNQGSVLITPIYDPSVAKNVIRIVNSFETTKYVNSILIFKNENRETKNITILKKSLN